MNTTMVAGTVLSGLGLGGYLIGLSVAYPGRAFSVTVLMVGITLAAIGRTADPEDQA